MNKGIRCHKNVELKGNKKMKTQKRVIGMLLMLVVFTTLLVPGQAQGSGLTNSPSGDLDEISSYVGDVYLSLFDPLDNTRDSVYLGNKLSSYRVEDNGDIIISDYEVYPIIRGNSVVGIANVIKIDGVVYQISCGVDFAPELYGLLSNNQQEEFAVLYSRDGVYIESSSGRLSCIKQYFDNNATRYNNISIAQNINLEYASLTKAVEITEISTPTRALEYKSLSPVTVASNTSTTCCPGGLCTYASIATITNYFEGTSRTALTVHSTKGHAGSNYNSDVITWLKSYGRTASGSSSFNYSSHKNSIDATKFSLIDCQATGSAHYLISHGYAWETTSTTKNFYYLDTNNVNSGYISSFPSSGTVYIAHGGYNYWVNYCISVG